MVGAPAQPGVPAAAVVRCGSASCAVNHDACACWRMRPGLAGLAADFPVCACMCRVPVCAGLCRVSLGTAWDRRGDDGYVCRITVPGGPRGSKTSDPQGRRGGGEGQERAGWVGWWWWGGEQGASAVHAYVRAPDPISPPRPPPWSLAPGPEARITQGNQGSCLIPPGATHVSTVTG